MKRFALIAALVFALAALSPDTGAGKDLNFRFEDDSFRTGTCARGGACED